MTTRTKLLLAVPSLFMVVTAHAHALSTRETLLKFLKDYSPDGYDIVNGYEKTPDEEIARHMTWKKKKDDFMEFVRGDSEKSVLGAVNMVVHETSHTYSALLALQLCEKITGKTGSRCGSYHAYRVGKGKTILVKRTAVFNTGEMADSIPPSLRTFRYKLYVSPDTNKGGYVIGSKAFGVYGLLNEFDAYYHGNRAAFDMYPYYRDRMGPGPAKWHDYFSGVNRSFSAGLEFKFFILKYIQYAKNRHPDVYRAIMENRDFASAYLAVEKNHQDLVRDYYNVKKEVSAALGKEGYTFTEDDTNMFIGKAPHRFGSSNHMRDYILLKGELEKEEYRTLVEELQRAAR